MNKENPLLKSLGFKPRTGKIVSCKICEKEFYVKPSRVKTARYCSRKCHHKGIETGGRIKCKCKVCGKIYFTFRSQIKRMRGSKYCSKKCQSKGMTLFHSRENAHNWQGGKTAESKLIRRSAEWKKWRKAVFERDNYTCQECGRKRKNGDRVVLEPHHIKSFAHFPELRFEVSNGQTLCYECHQKTKTGK